VDFRDYVHALRRFWLVIGACVLVGLLAATTYNRATFLDQAKASVAVLSPLVSSKASGSTEAQVSFDAIIKSQTLASRVAARMNESTKTVAGNLSVTIDTGTGATTSVATSPLYIVHGRDQSLDRAERLVSIAVDEASQMYFKINATDGSDLKAAILVQRNAIALEVSTAQDALTNFETTNNAIDLPNRIAEQRARTDQLGQQVYSAEADQTGDQHSSSYSSSYSRDYNRYIALLNEFGRSQAELNRLSSLLPAYQKLAFDLTVAQTRLQDFDVQDQSLVVNSLLPAQVQVKILDPANEESQLLYLLLIYGLAVISGIVLGLAAAYVLALVYKRPATPDEVAKAVGAPVLVRIPRIA
jgi:capsular polysaccharide biosynthesis protein